MKLRLAKHVNCRITSSHLAMDALAYTIIWLSLVTQHGNALAGALTMTKRGSYTYTRAIFKRIRANHHRIIRVGTVLLRGLPVTHVSMRHVSTIGRHSGTRSCVRLLSFWFEPKTSRWFHKENHSTKNAHNDGWKLFLAVFENVQKWYYHVFDTAKKVNAQQCGKER